MLNNFIIGMGPDLEKGIVREANLLKKFYKERGKITLALTDPIVIILQPNDWNITLPYLFRLKTFSQKWVETVRKNYFLL